jgi:hypothetical protein
MSCINLVLDRKVNDFCLLKYALVVYGDGQNCT